MNAVTLMKEELKEKKAEVSSLSKQLADVSAQLSASLTEKEAALSSLSRQHEEQQRGLLQQVQDLSLKVSALSREKASALEQADCSTSRLSEWKKEAQSRYAQYQNTIESCRGSLSGKQRKLGKRMSRYRR